MTQTVVVNGIRLTKHTPYIYVCLSLMFGITFAILLADSISMDCNDMGCDVGRIFCIFFGFLFILASVFFLVGSVFLHIKIKEAMRESRSRSVQVADPVSPRHLPQPVVYSVMQTEYPPPYSPTAGPSHYPLTPPDQYKPQVGSAVSQPAQPNTQYPSPYSPPAGPSPYPLTPPDQYKPLVGSAVSQPAQPNTQQVTEPPPPYVP